MKRASTNWILEINDEPVVLDGPDHLKALLETPEAQSAVSLRLSLVRACPASRGAKFIYRFLGAPLEERELLGRLDVSLSTSHALAIFQDDDDDEGVVPIVERSGVSERIAFKTPRGESFEESASSCLTRDRTLQLFDEFFRTKKRPVTIKWTSVRNSKRERTNNK